MLLDRHGRPLRAPTKDELADEQAVPSLGSVRQIASGHPAEGLEPVRLAAILHSAETGDATSYLELAEQMEEKDLHYAAVLGVRKRAIRSLELKVDAGADDTAAQEAAELVRSALGSPGVRSSLVGIMDAIGKGFSVSEILWDRSGKHWSVSGIERVDPRWFEFDQINGRHLRLRGAAGTEELRPSKFIVHFAEAKSGLPIRGGLARLAAWAFMFKHFTIRDWAIFTEAYGHPLRLGKYDANLATPQDRATLLRAVRMMGTDMAAIIPESMSIEVIAAGTVAGSQELYEKTARYWDEQLSKGVLGQVATTDAIAGGHAVGKIHDEVRSDIRDADADDLAATLMRDLATPITRLNFGEMTAVPVIRFQAPERVVPADLLRLMEIAGPAGLRIAPADIYKAFALREPTDDEAVLTFGSPAATAPPQLSAPGAALALPPPGKRELAAREHDDAITAAIDEMIEGGDLQLSMDRQIGPLLSRIRSAGSYEAAMAIIAEVEAQMPDVDLVDLLARAAFSARLAGELGADI